MNNEVIEYRIADRIGSLSTYPTGWSKEINVVSWNNGIPKFDLREWSPDHERMSRGITLFEEEARKLSELLNEYFKRKEKNA